MTKDELLEKGIAEETADEIVAAFSNSEEDSLLTLQKALDDSPEMDGLFKADKKAEESEDGDSEDEDDYNEAYMKKYMKRYMKENKKSSAKAAKEVGIFGEKMEKAISDIDTDSEGAVVEMTDLAPFLSTQSEFNESMVKAISELAGSIDLVSAQAEKSYDLMQKSAKVQVEQARGMDDFLSTPQGRKGVIASADMQKAQIVSADQNEEIYKVLMKAVKEKDHTAGQIISAFESRGKNANMLNKVQKEYINDLLKKEAN